ncbi:MAG: GntR family transcriptional regulator [Dermatophilaceae bacterium]
MTSSEPAHDLARLPALPPRASTAEHAAQMLRLQIAQGHLLPGTKLREEHVSAAFAISRNTVREAFRLLSHERLVDHTLHRGVHVRTVTADDIRAMYATRRLVEPLAIEAAIGGTDGDSVRVALRELVDAAEAASQRDDWDLVGTADIDFHRVLMSACGSAHLSTMFEQLLAELRLAFLLLPDHRSLHEPYVVRNRRLVSLLDAGDRAGALAELKDYLDVAERYLLEFVK